MGRSKHGREERELMGQHWMITLASEGRTYIVISTK